MAKIISNPTMLQLVPSRPAWVDQVQSSGAWTELSAAPVFNSWLAANLNPKSGYLGSGPLSAIRDAYCYPAFDSTGRAAYFYGGGHTDGSCNAVVKFDLSTLTYSVIVPPTPPSAYPPSFTAPNVPIVYPSGASNGFFQSADTLTNAADLPYAAPFAARASSHTYSAWTFANGKLQTHYGSTCDVNVLNGTWSRLSANDYGPQLFARLSAYGDKPLQAGTHAIFDPVGGKVWVTAVPGDEGLKWRSHVMSVDPASRAILSMIGTAVNSNVLTGSESMCIAGRDLITFGNEVLSGSSRRTSFGWRINMDSAAASYFVLSGDLPNWSPGSRQESVPCFSNGTVAYLWNYGVEIDALYRVNLRPTSGTGARDNPYVYASTRVVLPASQLSSPRLVYRLDYIPEWGIALVMPNASSRWWALAI